MPGVDLRTRDCDGHAVVELRGELDISDAVIRSFERLGWATRATRARWPIPAHLGSCRSDSRQPDGIR